MIRLNRKQQWTLVIGISIFVLVSCLPPWHVTFGPPAKFDATLTPRISFTAQWVLDHYGMTMVIHWPLLIAEWCAVVLLTLATVIGLKGRKGAHNHSIQRSV